MGRGGNHWEEEEEEAEEEVHREVDSHIGQMEEYPQAWLGHTRRWVPWVLSEVGREGGEGGREGDTLKHYHMREWWLTEAISCRKNLIQVTICSLVPLREMLRSLELGMGSVNILILHPDLWGRSMW